MKLRKPKKDPPKGSRNGSGPVPAAALPDLVGAVDAIAVAAAALERAAVDADAARHADAEAHAARAAEAVEAARLQAEATEAERAALSERVALAETMYRAAQARFEAAEAREAAAAERLAAAEAAERAAAERLAATDAREREAEDRVAAIEARERAVAERLAATEARERAAAERDEIANERDRAATERDEIANERDRAAAARDAHLDGRLARRSAEPRAVGPGRPGEGEAHDIELEIARLEAELQRAHLDALTGTLRREMGRLALRNEIERARRGDGRFVIAFVDVDGLKGVNDRDGHAAGDRVLRTLAATMRANLRSYDPIVRYGGDEFVCGISSIDPAEVEHRMGVIDQSLRGATGVGISAGLATLSGGESLEELTAKADAALLEAKRTRDG